MTKQVGLQSDMNSSIGSNDFKRVDGRSGESLYPFSYRNSRGLFSYTILIQLAPVENKWDIVLCIFSLHSFLLHIFANITPNSSSCELYPCCQLMLIKKKKPSWCCNRFHDLCCISSCCTWMPLVFPQLLLIHRLPNSTFV